jgi:hypothetical protein
MRAQKLPRGFSFERLSLIALIIVLRMLHAPLMTEAAPSDFSVSYSLSNRVLQLSASSDSSAYFILERSAQLPQFLPSSIASGNSNALWEIGVPSVGHEFYRVHRASVFDPLDSDGDGIDDLWEISHGLNPLNASDALLDPDQNGLSFYQEYFRERFGQGPEAQFFSHELSTFNFGQPTANVEVFAKAVSVFNGEHLPSDGAQEVYAREVSAFNFGQPFSTFDQLTREVSVFNFDPPSAPVEASSKEMSVFNGEQHPLAGIQEIYSRELSTFNFDQPTAPLEAITRPLSLFNNTTNSP